MPSTPVRAIELIETGSLGKEVLSNDAFTNLARGISGTVTIPLSNADYPLSATEGQAFVLILSGTVTDDIALIVPQESRVYVVDNRCTIVGTHSITMRPPVGGGVTVETGYQRALMYCDGSNVYPVASGTAAGGGSGAPPDATYLVGSAHALLSGERVVTDTSTITWDLATAGQARAMIPPDAVSYSHIQNVSSSCLLGRFTGGTGDVQEITPGAGLTLDAGTGVLSATAVGQPLDATLTALAGLTTGANLLPYFTGVDTVTTTTLSAFVRTLLDDADAATVRGTISAQASDATLTALAGVTTGADTLPFFTGVDTASTTTLTAFMRGLLDDPDAATARSTLGVTGGGGGSADFLGLSDTPDSYSGQAGKAILVNAGATALEFGTPAGGATLGTTVQRVAVHNVATATTVPITFDTDVRDDGGWWSGAQPTRLTVATSGWYSLSAYVLWGATAGGYRQVGLRLNGSTSIALDVEDAGLANQQQNLSMQWYATAGEYVELIAAHGSGSTLTVAAATLSMVGITAAPSHDFLSLTDTPDTYTGQAGKVVQVNAGATATEYGPVLGTMAQQDASAVAITGGNATLAHLGVGAPQEPGVYNAAMGTLHVTAHATLSGHVGIGGEYNADKVLRLLYPKGAYSGIVMQPTDNDTGGASAMLFLSSIGANVGTIFTTSSGTAYNTTSDRRLKHAIAPLTGALDVIRALNPVHYLWNANDEPGEGFLAHELMQHVPAAVTGEPDAVNDDGSVRPQGVDHSKIVPHLTAALQELAAQVQTLTARIATLEAQLA